MNLSRVELEKKIRYLAGGQTAGFPGENWSQLRIRGMCGAEDGGHGAGGFIAQLQRPGNQAVKITFSDAGPLHAWQHVLLWSTNKAKERTGIPAFL